MVGVLEPQHFLHVVKAEIKWEDCVTTNVNRGILSANNRIGKAAMQVMAEVLEKFLMRWMSLAEKQNGYVMTVADGYGEKVPFAIAGHKATIDSLFH